MDENKYCRKGSLYKPQQTAGKEPRLPDSQDLVKMSRGTQYLALHQTIYSSLRPLSHFFDKDESSGAGSQSTASHPGAAASGPAVIVGAPSPSAVRDEDPQRSLDRSYFDTILDFCKARDDEPLKKVLLAHYRRFMSYFLQQSAAGFISPSQHCPTGEIGFSAHHEHDFYTPEFSSESTPLAASANRLWENPLRETLYHLFLRTVPPLYDLSVGNKETLSPEHLPWKNTSLYTYLDSFPSISWASPSRVPILSDYDEVEESRYSDEEIRYLLNPMNGSGDQLEVFFDVSTNVFVVKGKGYSREWNGRTVHPEVLIDKESSREMRTYWTVDDQGSSQMDMESYDQEGILVLRSSESLFSEKDKELQEARYRNRLLEEAFFDIHLEGSLDSRRHFRFNFNEKGYLTSIDENTQMMLPPVTHAGTIGIRELREASLLRSVIGDRRLPITVKARWEPRGKKVIPLERTFDIQIAGVFEGTLHESADPDYLLSSHICDTKGQTLLRRISEYDESRKRMTITVDDRVLHTKWEQRVQFSRDMSLLFMTTIQREPHAWSGGALPHSFEQKITHLLPGAVIYTCDISPDNTALHEQRAVTHNFEKLLGTKLIKASEIKKNDNGITAVTFSYEPAPNCRVEEEHHYISTSGDMIELSSHLKKRVPDENLFEEKVVKRNADLTEETVEISRKRSDIEYQETSTARESVINRYIRSRKRSEKAPIHFFPEQNRWLDLMPAEYEGSQCHISTYIHEKIDLSQKPSARTILVREETYDHEHESEGKRDILNFLAFLDDEGNIHYRTKVTSMRKGYERILAWEDGELIDQTEVPHKPVNEQKKTAEPVQGKVTVRSLRSQKE
ncbi:MAG: hypothetical protein AB9903_17865 [Vulcanimicrobiota bacterium]